MKTKRILALVLALTLVLAMAMSGCSNNNTTSSNPGTSSAAADGSSAPADDESSTGDTDVTPTGEFTNPYVDENGEIDMDLWTADSGTNYETYLGDFMAAYDEALAESLDSDRRNALMAIAEAKFLEQGIAAPTFSSGGNNRLSRVAPFTYGYADWSGEGSSYEDAIVTTELIKAADYAEMESYWNEHRGDGTYMEWVKNFLTEKGYEFKDNFAIAYSNDPQSWDPMNSSRAEDGQFTTLTYEPLYGYDQDAVSSPASAESYTVSEDGLTWTFKLRQGVNWVDSQGRDLGPVTADAWVAGMQHVLDAKAGLESLVSGRIKGATEYIAGEITDFAEVGVKAVDDYTLEYTLEQPVPYFLSMLSYSVFAPLCRSYYESMGGTFGEAFTEGDYGKDANSIAYNGPFICTNSTAKNIVTFSINEAYWDYENTNLKQFSYKYNDGSDTTKSYTDVKEGTTDLQTLNTATLAIAESEGVYPDMVHVTLTGGTTYMRWLNVNRATFNNTRDANEMISSKSDEDKVRYAAAVKNIHFRRAVMLAMDRIGYRAQSVGDALAPLQIRNTYTPGKFVQLTKDVTVPINGTDTTFPAGTFYGEMVQAQMDADGFEAKVWDEENGAGDGFDGWYNPEAAKAEMALAVEELAAEGIEISAEKPLVIETPNNATVETSNNAANYLKKNVESDLDGLVEVVLNDADSQEAYTYSGYYCDYGYEMNYDLFLGSGWGPDYADPSAFMDTLLPDYNGYMTMLMGMF